MGLIRRFFTHRPAGSGTFIWAILLLAGCSTPAPEHSDARLLQLVDESYRQEVVLTALGMVGAPYRYGGTDPEHGFDCSGLVHYVFHAAAGTAVPRSTGSQAAAARRVSKGELRAGDLVFFNTLGRAYSHVGIYLGDGQFVNAPSSGGRVRVDSMHSPYFKKRFDAARSLFAAR